MSEPSEERSSGGHDFHKDLTSLFIKKNVLKLFIAMAALICQGTQYSELHILNYELYGRWIVQH